MPSKVTILGSGTCVPSLVRNPCSFLMQSGEQNLLFDCGPGVMRRLLEVGVSIDKISHIFLSHFHPDHTGELASFLFALKYPHPASGAGTLTIVAGWGFKAFFERLQAVYGKLITLPPERLTIIEMDTRQPDHHAFPSFTISTMPVAHGPESIAYRIVDAAGKAVVYSGDTDTCEGLITIATDADLMICESAFPDDHKVDGHLTPSQAGHIAQRAGVRRLVLTHFYPECDDADIENQCRSTYSGAVILAKDMMTLTL